MPGAYRPGNLGGIAGSGIPMPRSGPDYSGAIDSVVSAFRSTREDVIRRTQMQQAAQLARDNQARQQQALELDQQRFTLEQQRVRQQEDTAANALIGAGHDELSPDAPPPYDAMGKAVPISTVGNRRFVLNPANTKEAKAVAQRKQALSSLGGTLKPADIEVLANNPGAFDAYVSAHYGPSSTKETPEEKIATAVGIAKATRGIPTYADLHPKTGTAENKEEDKRATYILSRAAQLQKPPVDPETGLAGKPADRATAEQTAAEEFDRVHGGPTIKKPQPTTKQVLVKYDASTPDADLWERYKAAGLSSDQATAKVKARKK